MSAPTPGPDLRASLVHAADPDGVAEAAVGRAGSVDRGSVVELYLWVRGERIDQARFLAFGAPEVFACAAAACEAATGMALEAAGGLTGRAVAQRAGVDAQALGEALVVEDALRAALERLNL